MREATPEGAVCLRGEQSRDDSYEKVLIIVLVINTVMSRREE